MGKPEQDKSDGLEIISIGTLYHGPWDKKYWSSSRGKDRYPYPVGYQALRTHNGVTYKMEIHDGLNGPLFMISSTDGPSRAGQTPDIAWESFQKKGCPHIKLWHGKRYSCKIDGVEFFGFKNALVQRLLRELVANIRTTEQSLLSSSPRDRSSGQKWEAKEKSCQCLDLQSYLAKPLITRKRSKKQRIPGANSVSETSVKRRRAQDQVSSSDALNSGEGLHENPNSGCSLIYAALDEDSSKYDNSGALLHSVNLKTIIEGEENPLSAHLLVFDHLTEESLPLEENEVIPTKDHLPTKETGELSEDKELFKAPEKTGFSTSELIEVKDGEASAAIDLEMKNEVDLYAPDTLDNALENNLIFSPNDMEESARDVKGELIGSQIVVPEVLGSELCLEELVPTSNAGSEKSDSDSVGQEIANSMMTFLLPRALPLLKTFSRRKKSTKKSSEIDLPGVRCHEGMAETDPCVDFSSASNVNTAAGKLRTCMDRPDEKKHNVSADLISDYPGCENGDAVPDSYDNDWCANPVQLSVCHGENNGSSPPGLRSHINFEQGNSEMLPGRNEDQELVWVPNSVDPSVSCAKKSQGYVDEVLLQQEEVMEYDIPVPWLKDQKTSVCDDQNKSDKIESGSNLNTQADIKPRSELDGNLELVGCYIHPMPISLVVLSIKGTEIYVCVICGHSVEKERTLFVYRASIKGNRAGNPSFIGYAHVLSPVSIDAFGRKIAADGYGLQFTPDGQCLVLLNSFRAPHCREGKMNCPCSTCRSDSFEGNAVKIVQPKLGYLSVISRLSTIDGVSCILVCGPCYLVAAEESGRLHLWIMNSSWSELTGECYLPTSDCIPPIMELKKIPKCASLILGHNGCGEFCLWDISKRSLVSRFSTPTSSVLGFLPVSLFKWQRQSHVSSDPEYISEILDASKRGFFEGDEKNANLPVEGAYVAIWLLTYTLSGDANDCNYNSVGSCSLALLAENKVILGGSLDPRATAVGLLGDRGIIGRCDGLVYMWDLATGTKLGNVHIFEGAKVSCIASDDSSSGALAIASDGGELLIYSHSESAFVD